MDTLGITWDNTKPFYNYVIWCLISRLKYTDYTSSLGRSNGQVEDWPSTEAEKYEVANTS